MHFKTATPLKKKLREAWGDGPCEHRDIESEQIPEFGVTGWFCLNCGREVYLREVIESHPSLQLPIPFLDQVR